MKTLASSLALTLLIFGCAERKSDAYQTLQVERDTLAPVAAQLEAEKAALVAQLDALKSGADASDTPKSLPDRIKLTLDAPREVLEVIEPQRADDAATDALLRWFKSDYEGRGINPTNIELQADDDCEGSQVLRELSAAKLYFFAQRRFWRPLRGLALFSSMPIKDNPIFELIETHGHHLAKALAQARTQIEATPNWEDHFAELFDRAQRGYVGLEHFVKAGFPTFEDQCLLSYTSYQEPPRAIELEDGSLHAELATERLSMDGDSPAGSWLYTFWLRRYGDGTMPVVSMVLDGYLAYKGGDQ